MTNFRLDVACFKQLLDADKLTFLLLHQIITQSLTSYNKGYFSSIN